MLRKYQILYYFDEDVRSLSLSMMMSTTSEVLEFAKKLVQTMLRLMLRTDIGEIILSADVVDRHISLAN